MLGCVSADASVLPSGNFITDATVRLSHRRLSGHRLTVHLSVRPSSIVRVTTLFITPRKHDKSLLQTFFWNPNLNTYSTIKNVLKSKFFFLFFFFVSKSSSAPRQPLISPNQKFYLFIYSFSRLCERDPFLRRRNFHPRRCNFLFFIFFASKRTPLLSSADRPASAWTRFRPRRPGKNNFFSSRLHRCKK
jgi:hypothetical protein